MRIIFGGAEICRKIAPFFSLFGAYYGSRSLLIIEKNVCTLIRKCISLGKLFDFFFFLNVSTSDSFAD